MSSPEVWLDAKPRIEAAALALGLPVAWPNEQFEEPPAFDDAGMPTVWVAVEVEGDVAEPIELGDGVWDERGMIHLSLMIPMGAGIMRGLEKRKGLATAFRQIGPNPVTYRDIVLDPGGPGETDGRWRTLGLRIAYSYQDQII